MTTSSVRLRAVSKVFAGPTPVHALHDVTLDLHPGLTVVAGPSGSGKTTLLALLGAMDRSSTGQVWVDGIELGALASSAAARFRRSHVGFVFQDFKLFRVLDARDNVALPLQLQGRGRRAARREAVRALEAVGLGARARAYPATLSGGEQQRVAVARALVTAPRLVLADEPTANLDWTSGRDVVSLLARAAHTQRATIVVVSHDRRVAEFADRVIHLLDGRLVTRGRSEEAA